MKKIFPIILLMFIIITIFSFPTIMRKNVLRTNYEIEKQTIPTETIYLLNKDDYLVEVEVIPSEDDLINDIWNYLQENQIIDSLWKGYIPKNVELISYQLENRKLEIFLSEEAYNLNKRYLAGIVSSYLKQKTIEQVEIYIGNNKITDISSLNLETNEINRKKLEKMTFYYIEDINYNHLVPITKYLDEKNEKINVIIEELKNNIPNKLISYVSDKLKIIDYSIEKDVMIVNFNQELIKDPEKKEWMLKQIAYSIMANYDVNTVIFKVEDKQEEIVFKNN